jgi:hypothetical protein
LLAIPAALLADAMLERESRSETVANHLGTPFAWPENSQAADPEFALRILTEAATATGSTVLRTTVNTSRTERKSITHYVLVGGGRTALFDEFTLAEGRWLSPAETRDGLLTISSARAGKAGNVGAPAVFGDRYDLTFAPLRRAFESLPSSGRYWLDSPGPGATKRFFDIVRQRLGEAGVTDTDLTRDRGRAPAESGPGLQILAYLFAGVATLLVAFLLLREGKRIGVLRLVGHPAMRIWYEVVGRLQVAAVLVGLGACAVVVLAVPGVDALFLRTLTVTFLQVLAAGFAATLGIGLVLVNRVHISDLVKGSLQ